MDPIAPIAPWLVSRREVAVCHTLVTIPAPGALSPVAHSNPRPAMNPSARSTSFGRFLLVVLPLIPRAAWASSFEDKVADVVVWVVIFVVPAVAIYLFWMVHILPEKIAEKRGHPQVDAIKTVCLLSLFFGGMLWPIAWIWAYSRPVLHKLAYGTDRIEVHGGHTSLGPEAVSMAEPTAVAVVAPDWQAELKYLRERVASLEAKTGKSQVG